MLIKFCFALSLSLLSIHAFATDAKYRVGGVGGTVEVSVDDLSCEKSNLKSGADNSTAMISSITGYSFQLPHHDFYGMDQYCRKTQALKADKKYRKMKMTVTVNVQSYNLTPGDDNNYSAEGFKHASSFNEDVTLTLPNGIVLGSDANVDHAFGE